MARVQYRSEEGVANLRQVNVPVGFQSESVAGFEGRMLEVERACVDRRDTAALRAEPHWVHEPS